MSIAEEVSLMVSEVEPRGGWKVQGFVLPPSSFDFAQDEGCVDAQNESCVYAQDER